MLSEGKVVATIAVSNLAQAKEFYGNTLGLEQINVDYGGVSYGRGESCVYLYESQYAGTNKATYASWKVDNIEQVVENLKAKGVAFEHYDMPDAELVGDIHVMGAMKSAWFKDPFGNILAVDSLSI